MDQHDKDLIEKALDTPKYSYKDIKKLFPLAHSQEAYEQLQDIYYDKYYLMIDSL